MIGIYINCTSDYDGTWYIDWEFKDSRDSTLIPVKLYYSLLVINEDDVGQIGYDGFTENGKFFAGIMYQGKEKDVQAFPEKTSLCAKFWLDSSALFVDSIFTWESLRFVKGTVTLGGEEYKNQDVSYKTFYISLK